MNIKNMNDLGKIMKNYEQLVRISGLGFAQIYSNWATILRALTGSKFKKKSEQANDSE